MAAPSAQPDRVARLTTRRSFWNRAAPLRPITRRMAAAARGPRAWMAPTSSAWAHCHLRSLPRPSGATWLDEVRTQVSRRPEEGFEPRAAIDSVSKAMEQTTFVDAVGAHGEALSSRQPLGRHRLMTIECTAVAVPGCPGTAFCFTALHPGLA